MQSKSSIELSDFPNLCGEWLRGGGPESDIVVSSRIRLARNLDGFPFQTRMTDEQRSQVLELIQDAIGAHAQKVDIRNITPIDRGLLVERHLISRELMNGDGPRGVIFGRGEMVSIMINEEDHLRIQCVKAGLDLKRVWRAISTIDRAIESVMPMVFSDRLGYLTACPTNVGTGMRVSVMLHLPALTLKQDIKRMHRAADHMNLAMRGLYGEGTQAYGDFWQISNQVTLGHSEEDLIERLEQIIPMVLKYERDTRKLLMEKERSLLDDRIERAIANLRAARHINVEETMKHLSMVRLGLSLGLISDDIFSMRRLNELFIICQPAHLQKREGKSLTPEERDVLRASLIREKLSNASLN